MSARKKNSFNRRVRNVYSQAVLTNILTLPERDFAGIYGMKTVEVVRAPRAYVSLYADSDESSYYHFRDNGADVLAVAHLDTVVDSAGRTPHFRDTQAGPYVRSGALDDRLGAYVILDMLPKLGITCDWLLTVGEEQGQSTAEFFDKGKDYDHVIEFDRGGTDVVMYQYDDKPTRELVQASGAHVGHGSFSDIAYLEHLGVKCFNWGVGYQGNYHSESGYAFLYNTFAMVSRYMRFYAQNLGTPLPHEPEPEPDWLRYGRAGMFDDENRHCWYCGEFAVNRETGYCEKCSRCEDCGDLQTDCDCYLPAAVRGKANLPAVTDGYGNSWQPAEIID